MKFDSKTCLSWLHLGNVCKVKFQSLSITVFYITSTLTAVLKLYHTGTLHQTFQNTKLGELLLSCPIMSKFFRFTCFKLTFLAFFAFPSLATGHWTQPVGLVTHIIVRTVTWFVTLRTKKPIYALCNDINSKLHNYRNSNNTN